MLKISVLQKVVRGKYGNESVIETPVQLLNRAVTLHIFCSKFRICRVFLALDTIDVLRLVMGLVLIYSDRYWLFIFA